MDVESTCGYHFQCFSLSFSQVGNNTKVKLIIYHERFNEQKYITKHNSENDEVSNLKFQLFFYLQLYNESY